MQERELKEKAKKTEQVNKYKNRNLFTGKKKK